MKMIVWTQYFHCVFSEMKTRTFENAFVWTGPHDPPKMPGPTVQLGPIFVGHISPGLVGAMDSTAHVFGSFPSHLILQNEHRFHGCFCS